MVLKNTLRLMNAAALILFIFTIPTGCMTAPRNPNLKMSAEQNVAIVPVLNYSDATTAKKRKAGGGEETVQIDDYLTGKLVDYLKKKNFNNITLMDKIPEKSDKMFRLEMIRPNIPQGSDVLIICRIYRFRDRKGKSFAVTIPSSVALDIRLVDLPSGKTMNLFEYNETQKSLTENILKIDDFIKRRGRWVHAIELAETGIEDGVNRITR